MDTKPLTQITFFASVFVMSWGLFVFTHVWVVVFFMAPIAVGLIIVILLGEGIAVWRGKQIRISKRTTNRLSFLLIVGALVSPGVGFLVGYVQVQMVLYGTGIDALLPWQETTLLSEWSDVSPGRHIIANYLMLEDSNTAQTKVNEWIDKRQAAWKSSPLTSPLTGLATGQNGQRWSCDLLGTPIVIWIEDQYLTINLDHNTAWKCMVGQH